jgi:hypothetical protein
LTSSLPALARRAFDDGVLCYLAVRTSHGPHLTPVVYAEDGGRLWVTTSRTSVKARAWRRDPEIAGLVRSGDVFVSFRGRVRTYDALDPLTWPGAAIAAPRLVQAATRFSLKNARFFAGYAVDARRVPFAWTPPGRLFASIDPSPGWVNEGGDAPIRTWGEWKEGRPAFRSSFRPLSPSVALDRRVPADVRALVGVSGHGQIAVDSEAGLTVLPTVWSRVTAEGSYHAVVRQEAVLRAGFTDKVPVAMTVDRSSAWRAADMAGLLLQGPAAAFSPLAIRRGRRDVRAHIERVLRQAGAEDRDPDDHVLIRLRPARVVWWRGWTTATATAR